MLLSLLIYAVLGILVGIIAGLFGVGGGLVVVPVMIFTLDYFQVDSSITMKISLATSFATICFTSISSVYAHHRKKAVMWPIFQQLAPGLVVGVMLGGFIVAILPNNALKIIFACFVIFSAYKMLNPNKNATTAVVKQLSAPFMALWGIIIGFVSALVGIGGGALTVPFLNALGHDVRKAIATSAAGGFPIAIMGMLSGVYHGWHNPALPNWSIGYVYLPALIGIASTSVIFAPYGAKLAHHLPVNTLKRCFGIFLLLMSIRIFWPWIQEAFALF